MHKMKFSAAIAAACFLLTAPALAGVSFPPGSSGGGGGTPGGSSGQIQYNNAGSFGGISSVAGSGDVSIGTTGAFTVTGIQGTSVSSPTGTGAVVLQASPTLTGNLSFGSVLLAASTVPTIASGFGTSASVVSGSTTAAFRVNVGTGGTASTGVVGLTTAANGWNCHAEDVTTPASFITAQTSSTVSSASFANYSRTSGASTAWLASDILAVTCMAY